MTFKEKIDKEVFYNNQFYRKRARAFAEKWKKYGVEYGETSRKWPTYNSGKTVYHPRLKAWRVYNCGYVEARYYVYSYVQVPAKYWGIDIKELDEEEENKKGGKKCES